VIKQAVRRPVRLIESHIVGFFRCYVNVRDIRRKVENHSVKRKAVSIFCLPPVSFTDDLIRGGVLSPPNCNIGEERSANPSTTAGPRLFT
jgi:hypothetical protein